MSERQYAEKDGRTLATVLSGGANIVYYGQGGMHYPGSTLVVDYDMSQLQQVATSTRCCELADLSDRCESIVINLPGFVPMPQREFDICAASRLLLPGGCLKMIVPPKSGEKRVAKMLSSAFSQVEHSGSGRTAHLFECQGPLARSFEAPMGRFEYTERVTGAALTFATRPGLFSTDGIDSGTQLLMDTVDIGQGDRVLDVGCGYGAIGVMAAVRGGTVQMVDCDCRAVAVAQMNLQSNALAGETLLAANIEELQSKSFDIVLSNPPTHGGSKLLAVMFGQIARVCKRGGTVAIVVREQLNYEKWLAPLGKLSIAANRDGYKVIRVVR